MSSDMLLIDGDCNLCNAISGWIEKHKSKSSVLDILPQSETGVIQSSIDEEAFEILQRKILSAKHGTVILVRNGIVYSESGAGIRVLLYMKWYWKIWFPFAWVVPSPIRNWAYRRVAKHRNKLN